MLVFHTPSATLSGEERSTRVPGEGGAVLGQLASLTKEVTSIILFFLSPMCSSCEVCAGLSSSPFPGGPEQPPWPHYWVIVRYVTQA